MASTRRLTAILAADGAGYSRLMGMDEHGTHERLKGVHLQLVDPTSRSTTATSLTTGDGLLVEFPSVVDAMRCAAEVQRGMIIVSRRCPTNGESGSASASISAMSLPNAATSSVTGKRHGARLEALAEPGGICVSGAVRDHFRDKLPYLLEDTGEQSVKNIARPIRVYPLRPKAVADLPAPNIPAETPRRRRTGFAAMMTAATAAVIVPVSAWWFWPVTRSPPT
jgi:class 3 adenylate cyclase